LVNGDIVHPAVRAEVTHCCGSWLTGHETVQPISIL